MKKNLYWEKIRGICIIAVIFIHSKTGMEFYGNRTLEYNYHYWIIMKTILISPVAIYLFISGYFVPKQLLDSKEIKFYFFRRVKKILVPYFFWTCLYSIINILFAKIEITPEILMKYILLGRSSAHLYFIIVLLQLVLITPMLIKYCNTIACNITVIVLTVLHLYVIYNYQLINKEQLPYREIMFTGWIIFYYLGILYRNNKVRINFIKGVISAIVTLILSVIETYSLLKIGLDIGPSTSFFKISSFFYAISLVGIIIALNEEKIDTKESFLSRLGEFSYGIYFVHIFILMVINKIFLNYESFLSEYLLIYHLITISLTLLVGYGIVYCCRKILKSYANILGF